MSTLNELHSRALQLYQAGDRAQAERLCWEILQAQPLYADAIYLLGVIALDLGQPVKAIGYLHHATLLGPGQASYHHALGEAYRTSGRLEEAVASLRQAVGLQGSNGAMHNALGLALLDQGKLDDALASFRQALVLWPEYERAHNNLGRVLQAQGNMESAAAAFRQAVRLRPDYAVAHNNLGAVLQSLGQLDEAIGSLQNALRLKPDYPEAHFNLGNAIKARGDPTAAAACYREAIRLRPDYAKAHNNLGIALGEQGQTAGAVASFQNAIRIKPDYAEAYQNLGDALLQQEQHETAAAYFEQALKLQPDFPDAYASLVRARELMCDWRNRDADMKQLWADAQKRLEAGQATPVVPFHTLSADWPVDRQLAVARSHSAAIARHLEPVRQALGLQHSHTRKGRLRIGYLSADFHNHATSQLMQGLFGLHDHKEFEIFAYSFGPDDDSSYRRRIKRDCDQFRDIAPLSMVESARQIYADGIHILVDLKGFTGQARTAIPALQPAPIQVQYLGYPGTMGAEFIDYLLTDRIVTPPEMAQFYTEKFACLPHCYQINDHEQPIATAQPTRAEQGLPEKGFVFCCFNNNYKIEPRIFDVWMRILKQIPGSVLWLFARVPAAEKHLRREAAARAVAPERLIFAAHAPKPEHLARHRLADLFLDTYYYNAHTTASDALWAGLPLVTCMGTAFAGRVAASLLTAVGLPELITSDLENYEKLAVHLARHPGELQRYRERLAKNRMTWPLFDTRRFARELEMVYREMWRIYAAGEEARPINITDAAT